SRPPIINVAGRVCVPAHFCFTPHTTMRTLTRLQPETGAVASSIRKRSVSFLRLTALWDAFLVALGSLRQNKLRTSLTLVGIVVGVAAVIAVVTIIQGLD